VPPADADADADAEADADAKANANADADANADANTMRRGILSRSWNGYCCMWCSQWG
jgi:hypothetical protein